MNLTKSLAVAGGVTAGVIGAVLLAGIITNEEVDSGGDGGVPQTLRLNSIPVRLGGYGLDRRRGGAHGWQSSRSDKSKDGRDVEVRSQYLVPLSLAVV